MDHGSFVVRSIHSIPSSTSGFIPPSLSALTSRVRVFSWNDRILSPSTGCGLDHSSRYLKCHQCTVTRTSVPLYSLNMILDVLGNFHHVWRRLSSPLSAQDRAVSPQCPTHQLPSCSPAPCVELHSHCLGYTPLRLSSSHAESILYGRSLRPTCRSLLFSLGQYTLHTDVTSRDSILCMLGCSEGSGHIHVHRVPRFSI